MTSPPTNPPPTNRPPAGSRVVGTEEELADAFADPTLGAVAIAVEAGTGEPLRVIAPVARTLWVLGRSRVQIGGGSWIDVYAGGNAHVEAWDGRIHATESAQFFARGQTQVYATDHSSGTATDAARVIALDDAGVTAGGAAIIRAGDRSTIRAGGAVYVEATGEARVHAGPHVVTRRYSTHTVITGTGTVLDTTDLDPTAVAFDLPGPTLQPRYRNRDRDRREPE